MPGSRGWAAQPLQRSASMWARAPRGLVRSVAGAGASKSQIIRQRAEMPCVQRERSVQRSARQLFISDFDAWGAAGQGSAGRERLHACWPERPASRSKSPACMARLTAASFACAPSAHPHAHAACSTLQRTAVVDGCGYIYLIHTHLMQPFHRGLLLPTHAVVARRDAAMRRAPWQASATENRGHDCWALHAGPDERTARPCWSATHRTACLAECTCAGACRLF